MGQLWGEPGFSPGSVTGGICVVPFRPLHKQENLLVSTTHKTKSKLFRLTLKAFPTLVL